MKKIYFALLSILGLSVTADAQRNIKLSFEVVKPAMDTNIITTSTVAPVYKISNVGNTAADSLQAGDTVKFYDPTCAFSSSTSKFTAVSGFIAGGSLPIGYYLSVSYSTAVTFSKIVTLVDPSTMNFVSAPFTSNKQYYWFVVGAQVTRPSTNIAIATDTLGADTGRVWINKATSVNEFAASDISITTYPNPAKDRLSFDAEVSANEDLTAQIIDMAGRLVHIRHYGKVSSGTGTFDVDLKNFSNGAYILKLMDGDKIQTARFSVQK